MSLGMRCSGTPLALCGRARCRTRSVPPAFRRVRHDDADLHHPRASSGRDLRRNDLRSSEGPAQRALKILRSILLVCRWNCRTRDRIAAVGNGQPPASLAPRTRAAGCKVAGSGHVAESVSRSSRAASSSRKTHTPTSRRESTRAVQKSASPAAWRRIHIFRCVRPLLLRHPTTRCVFRSRASGTRPAPRAGTPHRAPWRRGGPRRRWRRGSPRAPARRRRAPRRGPRGPPPGPPRTCAARLGAGTPTLNSCLQSVMSWFST